MRHADNPHRHRVTAWLALLLVVATLVSCKDRDAGRPDERSYDIRPLRSDLLSVIALEIELAKHDHLQVVADCKRLMLGRSRRAPGVLEKVDRLCQVDAPRLGVENTIALVRGQIAAARPHALDPDVLDLACSLHSGWMSFDGVNRHTSSDPTLRDLMAQFEALCPRVATQLRAR